MEPVYKETWYAPWCSAQLSRDLFVTCQPQHVVHCTDPARAAPFSPAQRYQLAEQKVGHLPARECTELFAPHMANYPCKIGNELLIPFFFSSTHAKGKKRSRYFKCLLNSTSVELCWELIWPAAASCFAQSLQIPACFQFTANFLVVPARSEEV